MSDPFRYFNSAPEVIRLVVMMYVKYPLSLRNVEDLLAERGIDISHETVRFWWNRFGPMFAAEIRKKRVAHMRGYRLSPKGVQVALLFLFFHKRLCGPSPTAASITGRTRNTVQTAGSKPPITAPTPQSNASSISWLRPPSAAKEC